MATQKYRIIKEVNNKLISPTFFIQRKGWFFWKSLTIKENGDSTTLQFKSFEDAEIYMRDSYFTSEGIVFKPCENEYHYTKYEYNYY